MALTNAERQRRYRARQREGTRAVRYRQPRDRRSRPERWRDAVETLVELQEEYREWLEAIPDGLEASPTAERLEEICEVDLSGLDVDPPLGYGRD